MSDTDSSLVFVGQVVSPDLYTDGKYDPNVEVICRWMKWTESGRYES